MNREQQRFELIKHLAGAAMPSEGFNPQYKDWPKIKGDLAKCCVEIADALLAELDRTKPEEQPEESQPFRIAFLELASDLKPRTVKQIRESLNLPESSNVGESLRSLQACLAGDETAVIRLRSKKSQSRSHSAIWWLERK